ncbi:AbgT family transporter [Enemella evansiae]|uniref:AbgT family transporter n=1 Tax=Enemella evansiae TaxID=2016499 RepID=UPI000B96E75F|nr:AbgT family transporter [Enemella evansiae]OYO06126.1 p-aminobenzoyl-glutamate transporter [Enemella evansiae]
MSTQRTAEPSTSRGLQAAIRSFEAIERVGNKLPHPFWLFAILALFTMVLSVALAAAGVQVHHPATGKVIAVKSLLTAEGVQEMVGKAVTNYANFPPLATILTTMLGIAVAQHSGLIDTLLRNTVTKVPARYLTFALAMTAMIGHVAGDSAYVALIPLGAMVFRAAGRSPILGAVVAFVSISAGYDASPSITTTDVLLSGITTAAAQTIDPSVLVTPLANYWFGLASSFVVALTITAVVELVLAKRPDLAEDTDHGIAEVSRESLQITPIQRRGLIWSAVAGAAFIALIVVIMIPQNSAFRGKGGSITSSPVFSGMALLLGIFFTLIGVVYGFVAKEFTKLSQVVQAMAKGIAQLAPILVLFFAISQFLAYFKWSGIGEVIAISGARVLDNANMPAWLILLLIAMIISVMNFIITSGSAMWSLAAPIFVPMLMLLGIDPATTQAMYRIADSVTNCVTPMSPYFVMALGFMQQYRRSAGIGTLASFTIPIAAVVWVVWIIFFMIWFGLGIPFGLG